MTTIPENQFDFWLGDWDLAWGDNNKGRNLIERTMNGKVIQENFTDDLPEGYRGMSMSVYDPERGLWCQTWVDNQGSYLDFTGKFEDGKMILSRDAIVKGEACKQRMVWFDIEANQFKWNWERSDDNGQTWKVLWHLQYTRRK